MYRKHRGKRASFIAFIVFAAIINLAPRYPEGGCGSPVRRVYFDNDGSRSSLSFGREHTFQYQDLNAPLRGSISWKGDNHSRLLLLGADPSKQPYPPLDPLGPADEPQELRNFTEAVEIAWGDQGEDEEIAIDPLFDFGTLFPRGVAAIRSVDIGYCSIPIPWIVDDPAKTPAAWSRASRLLGESFEGGQKGFVQVITGNLDESVFAGKGPHWSNGARANIRDITHAPDRKQQFWYRLADGAGEDVSRGDEICVQADYLFDYFVTFLGAIPISTACEEVASIRFCGRFDVSYDGGLRFTTSEVSAAMTGTEGTGTCKAVARGIQTNLEDQLRDPISGLEAGLNSALSNSSQLGLSRVEHTPSRLELVVVEDASDESGQSLRAPLELLGLCRDRSNSINERSGAIITHITDGIEIAR